MSYLRPIGIMSVILLIVPLEVCTPELKAVVCNAVIPVPPEWIEERYGRYQKLLKVNSWILRFVSNLKMKVSKRPLNLSPSLSTLELKISEQHLFARSQDRYFFDDRQRLSNGKLLQTSSTLIALNSSLGDGDLLVVGGRLSNSKLSLSQQHPPILSSKDHLTHLLFSYLHLTLCHCGPSLLLSHVGTIAHMIGAQRLARTVCRSCVICRRITAKNKTQQMGQLASSSSHTQSCLKSLASTLPVPS